MQVINNPKEDAQIPIVQNGTNYSMPFGTLNKLITQIYEDYDIPNALQQLQIQIDSADAATAKAKDTAVHPGYVDNDGYYYKWNVETKTYEKTDVNLKGEKGDTFTFDDLTEEQKAQLKGDKGDAFRYEDFTPEQIATLQSPATDAATEVARRLETLTSTEAALAEASGKADAATASANSVAQSANTAASNAETAATNANDTASRVAQTEDLRVTAESGRVTAESSRVAEFNTLKTVIEEATDKANTAATTANGVIKTMSNTVLEEEFAMSATAFIMCTWWNVSASPTPTAAGQYWWDGTALHVSSAVINAKGMITGYMWNAFDLSVTAVYIDSTTSAAYKYNDGAMVALNNNVSIIASQLRGINEVLSNINGGE